METKYRNKNNNFSNCDYCLYSDTCPRYESCEYISPVNDDEYCANLMEHLRAANVKTNQKYLLAGRNCKGVYNDKIAPMYQYYRQMINDCVRDIRAGLTTYVYNENNLKTILRFEPNINVVYQDGVFYVSL